MIRGVKHIASVIWLVVIVGVSTSAQTPNDPQKTRQRTTTGQDDKTRKPASGTVDRLEPDETPRTPSDVPAETQANRQEQMSEEAAVVPYYNNFFDTYRLGPEDVISVSAFNQDRYSRAGIAVPPSGRISLALIPGGVFVNGKTVDQVATIVSKT